MVVYRKPTQRSQDIVDVRPKSGAAGRATNRLVNSRRGTMTPAELQRFLKKLRER